MKELGDDVLKLPLHVRAEMAMKEAVHARAGRPAYIWRDGKVVALTPQEIRAHLASQRTG